MTAPLPNDASLAAYLRSLEESLLNPDVRSNRAQMQALLAADFVEFGASGRIWTLESVLDLLAEEAFTPPAIKDFQCIPLGPDATLVTWRCVRTNAQTGQQTASLRSSIWIKENGNWRLRFHQGTPAG